MCYKEHTFYKFNKEPIVSYIFYFISKKSYPCSFPSLFTVISLNHLISFKFIDFTCFQCKAVLLISLMMNNDDFRGIIQCNTKFNFFCSVCYVKTECNCYLARQWCCMPLHQNSGDRERQISVDLRPPWSTELVSR